MFIFDAMVKRIMGTVMDCILAIAELLGGIDAIASLWDKWHGKQKWTEMEKEKDRHIEKLANFLVQAQQLRERLNEVPLPIKDHNDWVDHVSEYLQNFDRAYEVRFSDFSGMTFYGDGSERSKMSQSLEGRSRRLNEFISEVTR